MSRDFPDPQVQPNGCRTVAQSEETVTAESQNFMNEVIPSSQLRDGRRIEVAVSGPGDSMSAVAVRVTRDGKVMSELDLPYPGLGLAGGRIILSPSERFAVLSMFSGQSEESYELFRVGDDIERLAGIPYQYGEVASFCFSEHEDILLMALPFTCCEWWQLREMAETEPDGDRLAFGFGQIRVHKIATNRVSLHEIRVSIEERWKPGEADYDPDLKPRLEGKRLLLSMPWGETEIPFPNTEYDSHTNRRVTRPNAAISAHVSTGQVSSELSAAELVLDNPRGS